MEIEVIVLCLLIDFENLNFDFEIIILNYLFVLFIDFEKFLDRLI